jgi:hypothetical protein
LADELDGVKLSVRADVADEVAVAKVYKKTIFASDETFKVFKDQDVSESVVL